jgi:hypothetical protein
MALVALGSVSVCEAPFPGANGIGVQLVSDKEVLCSSRYTRPLCVGTVMLS